MTSKRMNRAEAGEILSPYASAWRKLQTAMENKIKGLADVEVLNLISAATLARSSLPMESDAYWSSFEVERIARAEANRRTLKNQTALRFG